MSSRAIQENIVEFVNAAGVVMAGVIIVLAILKLAGLYA